jgi:hypothetical protein
VAADPSLPTRRCLRPASLPAGRQRGASAGLVHCDSPFSLSEALSGLDQAQADSGAQASADLPQASYPSHNPTRAYPAGRRRATQMSVGGAGGLSPADADLANGSREVPPELWERVESVFRHNTVGCILLGDLINFARATHPITSRSARTGPRLPRRTPLAARARPSASHAQPRAGAGGP